MARKHRTRIENHNTTRSIRVDVGRERGYALHRGADRIDPRSPYPVYAEHRRTRRPPKSAAVLQRDPQHRLGAPLFTTAQTQRPSELGLHEGPHDLQAEAFGVFEGEIPR